MVFFQVYFKWQGFSNIGTTIKKKKNGEIVEEVKITKVEKRKLPTFY